MDLLRCREALAQPKRAGVAGADLDVSSLRFEELRRTEWPAALAVRNAIFSPLAEADWERDAMTASAAWSDEECLGCIPLVPRPLVASPGTVVDTVFENAVGTRADVRSRGIGSGMIAAARRFLRDRVDLLAVYRGGERTDGYRFYAKTGHDDLAYIRSLECADPGAGPLPARIRVSDVQCAVARESDLLRVYGRMYGGFGGHPPRVPGSLARALMSSIYVVIRMELSLLTVEGDGGLAAYAVIGVRRDRDDRPLRILEGAAVGASAAQELAEGFRSAAALRGRRAELVCSDEDPLLPAFSAAGFAAKPRQMMIMAQVLDPGRTFARLYRPRLRWTGGLRLWTPRAEAELCPPVAGRPSALLEMKDFQLTRWLSGRLDLPAALGEGSLSLTGGDAALLPALAKAVPRAPWSYHDIDYI